MILTVWYLISWNIIILSTRKNKCTVLQFEQNCNSNVWCIKLHAIWNSQIIKMISKIVDPIVCIKKIKLYR